MKQGSLVISLAVVTLLAPGLASAAPFGESGTLVIGGERLFGIVHATETTESGDMSSDSSLTRVSLLGNTIGGLWVPSDQPRLALDYFATSGLTVGGSITYDNFETGADINGTIFLLSPRLGYGTMLAENLGIWPRAGITYAGASGDTSSSSVLLLNLDAMLVLSPAPGAAITLGPTFDYALSYSSDVDGTDTSPDSYSLMGVGLQGGLAIWF